MKTKALACLASYFLMFSVPAILNADQTLSYRNIKTIGLGDAKVAGGFDYNGFVDNPALLSRVKVVRFSIVNIPVTINKNVTDIAKFIDGNSENFENYDDDQYWEGKETGAKDKFLRELEEFDGSWSRAKLAPMFDLAVSIAGYSVGLALYNNTSVGLKMDRGVYEPRVWGEGNTDFAAILGFAKPLTILYPGLTVGMNLKFFQRRRAELFHIKAMDLGKFEETIEPIIDDARESRHNTFAVDIGTLWDVPAIGAEVGATIQSIGDGRGSSVDIGVAKHFFGDKVIVLADYIDFFDNNKENIFRKIHIGTQFNLDVLKLRLGLNSGYPVAGLGLNFKVIDLDFAYFSEELSNAPGVNDETRYAMQVKIGW